MARTAKPKKPTKQVAAQTPEEQPAGKVVPGVDSADLVALLEARIGESKKHWDSKEYKLDAITKENEQLYLGAIDEDDEDEDEVSSDNRIFSAIRTIVPYVTTRITEPEVYPSSNSEASKKFAEDFEKALHIKADKENVKAKVKFAIEDAIIKRRGYLKPRYDAATGNFCSVEYVPCESIIVDHKAKAYEEPRYFRHVLDKTPEDLVTMFPDKKQAIMDLFNLTDKSPKQAWLQSYDINEDWTFITVGGKLDLLVCWHYKQTAFGVIQDPNWRYDGANFLDTHMMPLVSFNVLNDGRSWIDKTSYVEQAKFNQKTVDRRSEQIGKNAGLGSVGMPIINKEALAEDQADLVTYESDTAMLLAVPEGKSIRDVFDKWQASPLSPDVYKEKLDAIEAVNNAFGASSINQGAESNNKTLGQDELLRDQSQGRQQDIVDAIDNAMNRLYLLMAQFMLVYGDEKELFRYVGENASFDYIIMNTDTLDTNAEIRVKAGTSMPIDKAQRRATADKAASLAMIDPLSFWEIMDEPNAQKYAKRLTEYTADPAGFLKDIEEELFNRDAYVDLELIKLGQTPPYREDLDKEYFDYLNKIAMSGALDQENPNIDMPTKEAMVSFINQQLVRGQKMLGMAETQLPTAQDVQAHNQQVDAANAAAPAPDASQPGQPAPASKPGEPAKPLPTPVAPAV